DFWMFMREQKATSFGGGPFTYEMLKRVRFFRMKLPDLRTFTQAGGKLAPELHKEFAEYAQQTGKHFVVMYGQTEATARMSYLPYEKSLEKYGSIGIAIPGG
ncbi:MAG: AMP-binding protein, partial [Oscillospiraceae bacterium]|nr:AMP-binding protein [Oscillospiraceae bacterium]